MKQNNLERGLISSVVSISFRELECYACFCIDSMYNIAVDQTDFYLRIDHIILTHKYLTAFMLSLFIWVSIMETRLISAIV